MLTSGVNGKFMLEFFLLQIILRTQIFVGKYFITITRMTTSLHTDLKITTRNWVCTDGNQSVEAKDYVSNVGAHKFIQKVNCHCGLFDFIILLLVQSDRCQYENCHRCRLQTAQQLFMNKTYKRQNHPNIHFFKVNNFTLSWMKSAKWREKKRFVQNLKRTKRRHILKVNFAWLVFTNRKFF